MEMISEIINGFLISVLYDKDDKYKNYLSDNIILNKNDELNISNNDEFIEEMERIKNTSYLLFKVNPIPSSFASSSKKIAISLSLFLLLGGSTTFNILFSFDYLNKLEHINVIPLTFLSITKKKKMFYQSSTLI